MGKDRRKKDGNQKQADTSVGSEPKSQRQPRNRAPQERRQKDSNENIDSSVRNKIPGPTPSSQSDSKADAEEIAAMLANLKRETDDIEALKAKKVPHRQIISNWSRYEESLQGPDHEVQLQGADFETLLMAPQSGNFQFRSERTWDANVTALSGELFSLDLDLLADGLATIPLYKKLDVPISLFSEAELADMDYSARYCAVKFETTKNSSRSLCDRRKDLHPTTGQLLDNLLMKERSPVPTEEDPADKKTSLALSFDIVQPEVQNDVSETEAVNVEETDIKKNSKTDPDAKTIPQTGSKYDVDADIRKNPKTESDVKTILQTGGKPDVNKVISSLEAGFNKTTLSKVPAKVHSEAEHDIIPTEEIDHESKTVSKIDPSPKIESVQSLEMAKGGVTKKIVQQPDLEQSSSEHVLEPTVPLGKRSNRHKSRSHAHIQTQAAEVKKVDDQKHKQADDDLDSLLSLKKPVREAQISNLKPSQVTKPTIEDDDDTAGPNSSRFPLMAPEKQSQDLEDWLDSMLDD